MADMLVVLELKKISKSTEETVIALKALTQQVALLNKTMAELTKALHPQGPRDY